MLAQEELPPCSTVTFNITLSNNFRVSTNNPSGVQWINQQIRVSDDATVFFDRNVSMQNCTVRIGNNSKIIIEGSYGLSTSNDCVFAECGNMWDGIVIKESAYVQLDDTDFQNAKSALAFEKDFDTYNTRITACDFTNNNIGILVGQKFGSQDIIFTPQAFHGNNFIGGNLLLPMYGKISYAGIYIYRSPTAIVGDYSDINTFRNSLYGVYASSSSVGVVGCEFYYMAVQSGTGGYGIYSNGNFMGVARSSFGENAIGGIYAQLIRSLVVFDNCIFDGNEKYGIFCRYNPLPGYFWVFNNFFTMNKEEDVSAIYHERIPTGASSSSYNLIYNNSVVVPSSPAKSHDVSLIDIYAPYGGSDQFNIEKNFIGVNSRSTAIHGIYVRAATGSNSLSIFDNDISYSNPFAPTEIIGSLGIAAEFINGQGNKINFNDVESTLHPTATPEERTSYIKCGIHLANSPNFEVCENTLNETYRAFHFAGDLNFCDFAKNTIGSHYHGLHCVLWQGMATNLGQQDWHQNVWLTNANDYLGYAAKYDDGDPLSIFNVDATTNPSHEPPSINKSNWFFDIPTGESSSNCVIPTVRTPEINDSDEKAMNETYPVESAAAQWDMERELLLKLLTYPELMPVNSPAEDWYAGKENSSPWKFANTAKAYRDAFVFPSNLQSALDSLYALHNETWDYVRELDSLQRINPYTVDSTILQDQIAAYSELSQLQEALEGALEDCKDFTETGLHDASEWIDELPTATIYEENLKNLYLIDVKIAHGDSLTEADYDILRDIANQCTVEGGSAVRSAPYRLPHAEAVTYLSEEVAEDACEVEERQQAVSQPRNIEFFTRPNPANDMLTVLLSETVSGTWEIYNLTGKLVLEGSIPTNSLSFFVPLGDIAEGIYFLQLADASRQVTVHKFIVLH
jgi:hypothetical protein